MPTAKDNPEMFQTYKDAWTKTHPTWSKEALQEHFDAAQRLGWNIDPSVRGPVVVGGSGDFVSGIFDKVAQKDASTKAARDEYYKWLSQYGWQSPTNPNYVPWKDSIPEVPFRGFTTDWKPIRSPYFDYTQNTPTGQSAQEGSVIADYIAKDKQWNIENPYAQKWMQENRPKSLADQANAQPTIQLPESVQSNLPTPIVIPNTPITATTNGTENRSTTITQPAITTSGRSTNTYTPPQSQTTVPDMNGWNQTSQRKKRGNLFSDVWGANSPIHTGSMYSNRGGFYNPV